MTGPTAGAGKDEAGRTASDTAKDLQAQGVQAGAPTPAGIAAAGAQPGKETAGKQDPSAKPDAVGKAGPLSAAQAKPAVITPQGSLSQNELPSPSGPVPAGLVANDAVREQALHDRAVSAVSGHKNGRFRISRDAAALMSPAELRAVAFDRGYEVPEGGRRGVLHKFLKEQEDDDSLVDPPEGHHLGRTLGIAPEAVVGAAGGAAGPTTASGGSGAASSHSGTGDTAGPKAGA